MNTERYTEWLIDCYTVATKSPDPSTQIGAMLVESGAFSLAYTRSYNGPTEGFIMESSDWQHPTKLQFVEHAERRALYKAAKYGTVTRGCTLVSTWAACSDCARAMVECDIKTLIRHQPPNDSTTERWAASVEAGDRILRAAGIQIIEIPGPILGAPPIRRAGSLWDPSTAEFAVTDNWHNYVHEYEIEEETSNGC